MTRTVLITGGTGQVSRALIEALAGTGLDVRALTRGASTGRYACDVEMVVGDLGDPGSLTPAFARVHDLWLLTANGPRAPEHCSNALWAARKAGVERVVRLSAVGAASDAPTRSGRLHALSDREVMASGMAWTILRPHWFMQNLLGDAQRVAGERILRLNMGSARLAIVDVRDVAAVAAQVICDPPDRHHRRIYTPTGPQAVTFEDVAHALGSDIRYEPITDAVARRRHLADGIQAWIADMIVEYGRAYATGWGDVITDDVERVTGTAPRSIHDFARDHAPAFRAIPPSC